MRGNIKANYERRYGLETHMRSQGRIFSKNKNELFILPLSMLVFNKTF